MQSFRDAVVREKLSNGAEMEDLPSAHLCSLPEEFGAQVLVVFVSRKGVQEFDFGLFGLFETEERATDALRKDFFLDCDQATLAATEQRTRCMEWQKSVPLPESPWAAPRARCLSPVEACYQGYSRPV